MKRLNVAGCFAVLCLVVSAAGQSGGKVVGWGKYFVGANANAEYQEVSAGLRHTLALRKDGTIAAWGYQADHNDSYVPICQVPGTNGDFIAVAAGYYHNLGLKSNGSIVAWGDNAFNPTNVPLPNLGYTAISASQYHSLALRSDGSIAGWGVDGSSASAPPPGVNSNFMAISAGQTHNLALKADGSVVAWGSNQYGQLNVPGTGSTPGINADFIAVAAGSSYSVGLKSNGSLVIWGGRFSYNSTLPSPNTGFVAIDANSSKMALRWDGTLWGGNVPDRIGNDSFTAISMGGFVKGGMKADGSVAVWEDSGNLYGAISFPGINAGYIKTVCRSGQYGTHFHALKSDGTLEEWGTLRFSPPPDASFVDLAAGDMHVVAIDTNGALVAWGDNDLGQLDIPVSNRCFVSVAAGWKSSLALDSAGCITGWGSNLNGELNVPAPNTNFTAIAEGELHSVALRSDGSLALWGNNAYGQASVPSNNTGFIAIACGDYHTLALRTDGSIEAWGFNSYDGECEVPLPNSGFVAVRAGGSSSAGIKADGTLVVWGQNNYGQKDLPVGNSGFLDVALCDNSVLSIRNNAIHVNRSAPPGGDGKSWATAFQYLQDGLASASIGNVVYVAAGTYKPDEGAGMADNDRNATFQLKDGVSLFGGFPATGNPGLAERDPDSSETVLSGDIDGNDAPGFANRESNSLHVLVGSGTGWSAVLDGFTVYGGYNQVNYQGGAGLFNQNGFPTVRDCIFVENDGRNGGGIFNDGNSPARIEGCVFLTNRAANAGGAIYNYHASPTIADCTFVQNESEGFGGGAIHADQVDTTNHIANCLFDHNIGTSGGALYNRNGAFISVNSCFFTANTCSGDGAAVYQSGGRVDLVDCGFFGNVSGDDGAVYCGNGGGELLMANCIATGNSATGDGGVLCCSSVANASIANCSFSGNSAAYYGGVSSVSGSGETYLGNNICWSNTALHGSQLCVRNSGTLSVENCILQGGIAAVYSTATLNDAGGSLDADPLFNDPDGADNFLGSMDDDLSLQTNSAAVDMGDNSAVPAGIETDWVGLQRIMDGDVNGSLIVDIGAYEFKGNPDLDGDGLPDWWEQQIIDADPNDEISTLAEVSYYGDFDQDGLRNYLEYDMGTDPTSTDSDGDTLSDGDEVYPPACTAHSNPALANSDGDRFDDAFERAHGMNPYVDDDEVFDYVTAIISNSPDEMAAAGLYTESAIRNLYIGVPLLQVDLSAQQVAIDAKIEWSDSLTNEAWQVFDLGSPDWTRTDQGWIHHVVGDHCFYRIFMDE